MSRKHLQWIVTLMSIVSFFGSTAYAAIGAINSALKQPRQNAMTTAASRESQLQAQERGYHLVLRREPENRVALEGLVSAWCAAEGWAGRDRIFRETGEVVP